MIIFFQLAHLRSCIIFGFEKFAQKIQQPISQVALSIADVDHHHLQQVIGRLLDFIVAKLRLFFQFVSRDAASSIGRVHAQPDAINLFDLLIVRLLEVYRVLRGNQPTAIVHRPFQERVREPQIFLRLHIDNKLQRLIIRCHSAETDVEGHLALCDQRILRILTANVGSCVCLIRKHRRQRHLGRPLDIPIADVRDLAVLKLFDAILHDPSQYLPARQQLLRHSVILRILAGQVKIIQTLLAIHRPPPLSSSICIIPKSGRKRKFNCFM